MSLPEERAARNEALFREVNEQARSLSALQPSGPAEELLIICECSDDRCTERGQPPLAVYEAVRATRDRGRHCGRDGRLLLSAASRAGV